MEDINTEGFFYDGMSWRKEGVRIVEDIKRS